MKKEDVMKKSGGSTVKPGFYWNLKQWEIVPVSDKPGQLPGDPASQYVRVPTAAMLLMAPVMGGAFVIFLPFIGFAMLGRQLLKLGSKAVEPTPEKAHARRRP